MAYKIFMHKVTAGIGAEYLIIDSETDEVVARAYDAAIALNIARGPEYAALLAAVERMLYDSSAMGLVRARYHELIRAGGR